MEEPRYVLKPGTRIQVHDELDPTGTVGVFVSDIYLNQRHAGKTGTLWGFVPGHGGDIYWVEHDDGSRAVYGWREFELLEE